MNPLPRKFLFVAAAWLFALSASFASAAEMRVTTAGRASLAIDGVSCGYVIKWQGGDLVGDLVATAATNAPAKKQIGTVRVTPITVELSLPPAAPLLTWINDFFANKAGKKTVTLTNYDFDNKPVGFPLEALGASLIEVNFEAFDAAGKDAIHLTVVFFPDSVRTGTVGAVPASTAAKNQLGNAFKFKVTGLSEKVSKVNAFTAKRRASAAAGTGRGETEGGPLPVEFSNLIVSLPVAQSADWLTWQDDFLVKGNHADAQEKTATLQLLNPALTDVLFSLQFSNVGIVRLSRPVIETGAEKIPSYEAELYYESLTLTAPGTATADKPASSTPGTPTPTPKKHAAAANDATRSPTGATAATASAPAESKTPTEKIPAGSPASPATPAKNAGDLGARDPAAFPRIDELTRKTFTAIRRPGSLEEAAIYSSKLSLDELLAAYEPMLKSSGWDQTMRNESGDPTVATHQFRLRWTKPPQSVEVRLAQTKTGVSEITVTVTSTRVGSLADTAAAEKTETPAVATGKSEGDQGARDPADFPRMAGTVRRSFSSSGPATASQESVVYRAENPINQVEAFYVKALSRSDWEETARREAGDPAGGTHQTTVNWSKARRTAAITLKEISAGTTEISVTLSSQ